MAEGSTLSHNFGEFMSKSKIVAGLVSTGGIIVTPGTSGNVLTSNGSIWNSLAPAAGLPTQTSNSGKYLSTDGTNASWSTVTGASAGGAVWENATTISANYTMTTNKNGFSVGPIVLASGVTTVIPSGQRWIII